MKDIVSEILEVEKRVEEVVRKAREEAAALRHDSDREVAALVTEAREKAQRIVKDAVDEAVRRAEKIRDERLEEAERKSLAIVEEKRGDIDALVDEVVRLVVGTAYDAGAA